MWVQSLGWEDPLEKEMATRSSIFPCKILWTEEPGGLQSTGLQRTGHNWATKQQQQQQQQQQNIFQPGKTARKYGIYLLYGI